MIAFFNQDLNIRFRRHLLKYKETGNLERRNAINIKSKIHSKGSFRKYQMWHSVLYYFNTSGITNMETRFIK